MKQEREMDYQVLKYVMYGSTMSCIDSLTMIL